MSHVLPSYIITTHTLPQEAPQYLSPSAAVHSSTDTVSP